MGLRVTTPYHGRTHSAGGSDPIPGIGDGWRFNIDNEGGWGYVLSNDSTDIDYGELGMVIGDKSGEGVFFICSDPDDPDIRSTILMTPTEIDIQADTVTVSGDFTFDGGGP